MEKVLRDKVAITFFVLPALVLFIAIVIAPIFISGYYSTLKWDGVSDSVFKGLGNYIEIFKDRVFLDSIKHAIVLAVLSVFVQIPFALFLALVLGSGVKGENFYRTVFFIPVVISTIVVGQLWIKMYDFDYGPINELLRNVGLSSLAKAWLGEKSTVLMAVFIPIIWQYIGYHMLLLYTAIKTIPTEIYEAAKIDGASFLKTSLSITIPLIRPMLKVCGVFAIIGSLKVFDLVYVLTNGTGGPDKAAEVPSTLMYQAIFTNDQYGLGSAMAIVIIAACLVVTVLIEKLFKVEEITY